MSSDDVDELKFQLDYYMEKSRDLSLQVLDAAKDREALQVEHDKIMHDQLQRQHDLYDQYAHVRTDITSLIDQFDWEDSQGRAYTIKCRHPDLKHILESKLNRVRKHHWHYDPNKHKDGFL